MPGGSGLIAAYYNAGPGMASVVATHPSLKDAAQGTLSLLAGFTTLLVRIGPAWVFGGILLALLLGLVLGLAVPCTRRIQ